MKFGGTSVGSPARMKEVARLVTQSGEPVFVVLSAMSGTTNELVEMSNRLYKKNTEGAHEIIDNLEQKYLVHINELYSTEEYRQAMRLFLNERMNYLRSFTDDLFTSFEEKNIVAQGEILSTTMITNFLCEQGIKAALIPALDFMRTDKNADPDQFYIKEKLAAIMTRQCDKQVYITQGFICLNAYGEVDNLQRGGSDYTASLVGAALSADEIQIWTDIDGMHNNDPRVVENTAPVRQLHFEEASELAFFGAKILHPTCVQPASVAGIPIRLKNTMQPNAPGTIINNRLEHGKVKAVAAKDNIIAIRVESSRRGVRKLSNTRRHGCNQRSGHIDDYRKHKSTERHTRRARQLWLRKCRKKHVHSLRGGRPKPKHPRKHSPHNNRDTENTSTND